MISKYICSKNIYIKNIDIYSYYKYVESNKNNYIYILTK